MKKELIDLPHEVSGYRTFAFGKNLFAVAIGLILATIFEKTVRAISDCLIMPFVNYFLNHVNTDWRRFIISPVPGMDFEIGKFISVLIEFIITTIILYFIFTKIIKKINPEARLPDEPPKIDCTGIS